MKKKIAVVLTSVLILAGLLTTSYFTPPAASQEGTHWKIMLAQKYCDASIAGWLTDIGGLEIPGTAFVLNCTCGLPEPQPLGQFVFWKVWSLVPPHDIHFVKRIDLNKDGIPDYVEPINDIIPGPIWPEEPHTWYQHVQEGEGPFGHWMVVVEVREQPYDPDRPIFEWQTTMKTHGVNATWTGQLTLNDVPITGTDFSVGPCRADPDLQCQVVQTAWCTVPNDILGTLTVDETPIPIDLPVTQFPWKYTYGVPGANVTLELTEVQSHGYTIMRGQTGSAGFLGPFPAWEIDGWKMDDGVPFATREPYLTPMLSGQVITFEQRDPITGIVKLGTPADSYEGLEHAWYSYDVGTWFRLKINLVTQGCGWLFTGVGKQPILGCVDYKIYNNESGVYTYGHDGVAETGDDEQLAGEVPGMGPGGGDGAAGAGPPIGPCLQLLRGPDGIPGTQDDPIGRGDPDGPDEPGSSLYYLPTTMIVNKWVDSPVFDWHLLFASPWPQLFTTGTAYDKVIEDSGGCKIDGEEWTETGQPWEFIAGLDHPGPPADQVAWKHPKCNAYVTYVCVWSVLNTDTDLGRNDNLFRTTNKLVRDDLMIADVDCNELVDVVDLTLASLGLFGQDEYIGPDGIPMTGDDVTTADHVENATSKFDFGCQADVADPRGLIDIVDLTVISLQLWEDITP